MKFVNLPAHAEIRSGNELLHIDTSGTPSDVSLEFRVEVEQRTAIGGVIREQAIARTVAIELRAPGHVGRALRFIVPQVSMVDARLEAMPPLVGDGTTLDAEGTATAADAAYELLLAGRYATAVTEYQRLAGNDPSILVELAEAYRRQGMRAEAIRALRDYLKLNPKAANRREARALLSGLESTHE